MVLYEGSLHQYLKYFHQNFLKGGVIILRKYDCNPHQTVSKLCGPYIKYSNKYFKLSVKTSRICSIHYYSFFPFSPFLVVFFFKIIPSKPIHVRMIIPVHIHVVYRFGCYWRYELVSRVLLDDAVMLVDVHRKESNHVMNMKLVEDGQLRVIQSITLNWLMAAW